ncbi:MAG: four helix bundle protein [Burkholderiaceae bacterium]|nr:four helix bundle protein [Burkholderiaceae bacterium]
MQEANTQHPTNDELTKFSLKAFKGVEAGLGQADPVASIAKTLEDKYPGHLILVQAGKFLHGYDRTAYALHTLKQYKLKLVGTSGAPHIRVGFPAGNFKRRLWPMVEEFGIPYVVSLGSLAEGRAVYVSDQGDTNAAVLSAVSRAVVEEVIHDLKMRGELNKASAKLLLANPDTSGFKLKSHAQDLDTQLLQDIVKMPRDLRVTYGENLRTCMARIMRGIYSYGLEDNKVALLKSISADVDLVKHYLAQGQRLSGLKVAFEHRAGLAVELGRLVGGLIRSAGTQP